MATRKAPSGKYWETTEYPLLKEHPEYFEAPETTPAPAPKVKPAPVPKTKAPEPVQYPVTPHPKPPKPYPRRGGVPPGKVVGPMREREPHGKGGNVPQKQEHALRKAAQEQYPNDRDKQDAFVYGTMRKQGWKPDHHSPWDGKSYRHWYWGKTKV